MIRILEAVEATHTSRNGVHPHPIERPGAVNSTDVDAAGLEAELRGSVRGEVRFDASTRAMYATDASNYRQVPIGLVVPKDAHDVEQTLAACRKFGAPVFSRGGGTSLAGEGCNAAVVMDFSKYMNEIVEIDWDAKTARVQPGCVNDDLRNKAEERHLTFGPDPATHDRNTFGGMIGNNSCGMHAQMAGKTEENVEELEIVTYDGLRMRVGRTSNEELEHIIAAGGRKGEIYAQLRALRDKYADQIRAKFPDIPRRVSGFPLNELLPENGFNVARALVGTESTCVTVVEATVRLVHSPPHRAIVILGFADLATAADHVPFCDLHKPIALEGMAASMFHYMELKGESERGRAMFPPGKGWLICEFGGDTKQEASDRAHGLIEAIKAQPDAPSVNFFDDHREQERFWRFRDNALRRNVKDPQSSRLLPGLGRLRGRSQTLGRLYSQISGDARRVRLQRLDLRALRASVRSRQHQLRSLHRGRDREVPRVRHEDGTHLRRARRLTLR